MDKIRLGVLLLLTTHIDNTRALHTNLYTVIKNADIPSSYWSNSTVQIYNCTTLIKCAGHCWTDDKCLAATFDSMLLCQLFLNKLPSLPQTLPSSDITYIENSKGQEIAANSSQEHLPESSSEGTSSPPTTTTAVALPAECYIATNLTEAWRLDHTGSNIKPGGNHSLVGYACDRHWDLLWFRFTGAAGNRMLNYCPAFKSCGALNPLWSDGDIPDTIGESVVATVHAVDVGVCSKWTRSVLIMRCSDDDVIYHYTGNRYDKCYDAFCGMFV